MQGLSGIPGGVGEKGKRGERVSSSVVTTSFSQIRYMQQHTYVKVGGYTYYHAALSFYLLQGPPGPEGRAGHDGDPGGEVDRSTFITALQSHTYLVSMLHYSFFHHC